MRRKGDPKVSLSDVNAAYRQEPAVYYIKSRNVKPENGFVKEFSVR